MTIKHKIIAASLIGLLLLTGFIAGRSTTSSTNAADTNAAEVSKPTVSHTEAQPATEVVSKDQFYLSDFKTGYNDGYQAGLTRQTGTADIETSRQGYNEGYKEGYTDAYQANAEPDTQASAAPAAVRSAGPRVVYRNVAQPVYRAPARKGRSKLKTALTIGAPAAIGAGIGAMFGGKKGAGIGALLGGGGGAIYELRKRRNRD
jgi:hypothetical protein